MDNRIQDVEEQIRKVEGEILAVTDELARAPDKDVNYLRTKEELLRKKEEQLREEKLIALRAGATAAGPGRASAAADTEFIWWDWFEAASSVIVATIILILKRGDWVLALLPIWNTLYAAGSQILRRIAARRRAGAVGPNFRR